jgi:predicted short-subunit dehydrogenase-like oxidoreductase (DUF2520 family)
VGCGRVGLTLGRLFARRGLIDPVNVLTRSGATARAACDFIGGGRPIEAARGLEPFELLWVFTSDAAIEPVVADLVEANVALQGTSILHASGALSSDLLSPLRARGAYTASIHPIRSFAAAMTEDDALDGVVCGAEGNAEALALATPLFEAAGARVVTLTSSAKRLYHAAAVLSCNHLVGLVESSLEAYAAAGVDRRLALEALEPLIRGTLDNVFARGPEHALSGPIVRGESALVAAQLEDLGRVSPRLRRLYRDLALQTLPLARGAEAVDPRRLDALARVLEDDEAPVSGEVDAAGLGEGDAPVLEEGDAREEG